MRLEHLVKPSRHQYGTAFDDGDSHDMVYSPRIHRLKWYCSENVSGFDVPALRDLLTGL
jgi:hypothetical protein